MPSAVKSTSLTITNPLILYRTLLATRQLEPDPAQHRLAIHLQKLYHRLKDYEPEIDFKYRINQLSKIAKDHKQTEDGGDRAFARQGFLSSIQSRRERNEALALTRRLTDHESATQATSPQGLLLYGEVGTGKSLLVDLLADSLPNRKKRRWHFNTFMLETLAKLEQLRRRRDTNGKTSIAEDSQDDEHSLLWLARDMISNSPILFLDEFQLPDRAASKILSNLLTSFFQLGGVLVATSNRMPEELANASGVEFGSPPVSKMRLFGNRWGLLGRSNKSGRSESMFSGKGDFIAFLEVLRARCEVWDMQGGRDWRRSEAEGKSVQKISDEENDESIGSFQGLEAMAAGNIGLGYEQSTNAASYDRESDISKLIAPSRYIILPSPNEERDALTDFDRAWKASELSSVCASPHPGPESSKTVIPWQPTALRVYGRDLAIPRQLSGVTKWTFSELCVASLGPADYITLASHFHTFILTDVPVLTFLQKNEARRFITLLDALYEARCKLLISAEAGPDNIFFPETRSKALGIAADAERTTEEADKVYSETFSEMYQDANAPFRPNVSTYTTSTASPPTYSPTMSSPFASTRSILADEDSDFGPVYGTGRSRGVSDGAPGSGNEIGRQDTGPDFSKAGAYTGEDERFAYKRASSRLWEMCGKKWWEREGEGWWKPLGRESRMWEGDGNGGSAEPAALSAEQSESRSEGLFRHGASPFRTSQDPPPKFSFVHAWGMMKWGKKAGSWGQGPDGLSGREVKGKDGKDRES